MSQEITLRELLELQIKHVKDDLESQIKSLKEIDDLHRKSVLDKTNEALRLTEIKLSGFPELFAKKEEMVVTARAVSDLKEKDLGEIKKIIEDRVSRQDFGFQLKNLSDRIDVQDKRMPSPESLKLEITSKIWSFGIGLFFIFLLIELVFKFLIPGVK